jgi:hypothetical protein
MLKLNLGNSAGENSDGKATKKARKSQAATMQAETSEDSALDEESKKEKKLKTSKLRPPDLYLSDYSSFVFASQAPKGSGQSREPTKARGYACHDRAPFHS